MNKYQNKLATPSGFRDILPEDAGDRENIIDCINRVYKRYGFLPLETPVAEFENILVSESVSDFNLFRLEPTTKRVSENDKEEIALRFDLTVPLARVVSQYGNALPRPFKRYQAGYVFRGERPQKGRFRQFMQFDADIVGTKSLVADVEMLAMITEIMKEVGVSDFIIRINTRTILNTLPTLASFPNNLLKEVLVVLDKSEKIGEEELIEELRRLRINESGIEKIKKFCQIVGQPNEVIEKLKNLFGDFKDEIDSGVEELTTLASYIETLGIQDKIVFDMKIIRGFGYYTGPVFETNLLKAPEFGSVISGGRYDNLVERFTNQSLPAVGISVGVDRFQTALQTLGISKKPQTTKKIVVLGQSQSNYVVSVASQLRNKDLIVDMYTGGKQDFKDIFIYAENVGAQYVAIIGSQEEIEKTVSIKNITTREQKTISFDEINSLSIDF